MNKWSEPPVLILPYSEARERQVWRRFSGALENVQNATLIGQFETRASVAGKGNGRSPAPLQIDARSVLNCGTSKLVCELVV